MSEALVVNSGQMERVGASIANEPLLVVEGAAAGVDVIAGGALGLAADAAPTATSVEIGSGGAGGGGTGGSGTGGSATGGSAAGGSGASAATPSGDVEDSDGCGCTVPPSRGAGLAWLFAALLAALTGMRRGRRAAAR